MRQFPTDLEQVSTKEVRELIADANTGVEELDNGKALSKLFHDKNTIDKVLGSLAQAYLELYKKQITIGGDTVQFNNIEGSIRGKYEDISKDFSLVDLQQDSYKHLIKEILSGLLSMPVKTDLTLEEIYYISSDLGALSKSKSEDLADMDDNFNIQFWGLKAINHILHLLDRISALPEVSWKEGKIGENTQVITNTAEEELSDAFVENKKKLK